MIGNKFSKFFNIKFFLVAIPPKPEEFQLPTVCSNAEPSIIQFIYCTVYLIACAFGICYAFYLYFKHLLRKYTQQQLNNGHQENRPDIIQESSDKKRVHWMLPSRQDTELQILPMRNGSK